MPCPPQVPISIIAPVAGGQGPLIWQNGNQITRLTKPLNPSWLVYDGSQTRWGDGSAAAPIYLPNLQQVASTSINYGVGLTPQGQVAAFANTTVNPNNALVIATGSTTPRTLANRFADVVNVKDFGAKGDGTTDDTAAIQSACDYAKTNGRTVKVVAGTYLISSSIFVQSSFIGDGEKSTVFLLKTGTQFIIPAIIATGIGYTAPVSSFVFSSNFNNTYYYASVGGILALQTANNRSCPWGVEISGFGITSQSGARDTVQQNGLILQHIAHVNISTIEISNLNGFGVVEDGLQDCVVSNISVERCGAGVDGASKSISTTAQYVIDQFWSAGGFDSTARVTHTYIQAEESVWQNMYVGITGSSGAGRGGSTENTYVGIHIEPKLSNPYDNSFVSGLLDTWVGGSLANYNVTIAVGRTKFIGVDAGGTNWLIKSDAAESAFFSNCIAVNFKHYTGLVYIENTTGTYTSILYSGNGSLKAVNCNFTNFTHANNWEVYLSNCSVAFGTTGGNMTKFRMNGGSVISATGGIAEGIYTGVTFLPSVIDLSYNLPNFNSCNFQAVSFNSANYNPKFFGCIFNSTVDDGSGGQAYSASEYYNCVFYNNVKLGNGNSKVFNSVINTGYTITATLKINNYNTSGSSA